jgi:hypothetical protein
LHNFFFLSLGHKQHKREQQHVTSELKESKAGLARDSFLSLVSSCLVFGGWRGGGRKMIRRRAEILGPLLHRIISISILLCKYMLCLRTAAFFYSSISVCLIVGPSVIYGSCRFRKGNHSRLARSLSALPHTCITPGIGQERNRIEPPSIANGIDPPTRLVPRATIAAPSSRGGSRPTYSWLQAPEAALQPGSKPLQCPPPAAMLCFYTRTHAHQLAGFPLRLRPHPSLPPLPYII